MTAPARLAHAVRRHGVRGTARHVTAPLRHLDATQIWYRLRLDDHRRPRRGLGDELVLRHGTVADAKLFEHLPGDDAVSRPTPRLIEERAAKGAQWWVVLEEDLAAFCCWTFAQSAPIWGAKEDIELPDDVVLLEDSYASPHVRGRGVAPRTWTDIAGTLEQSGYRAMITKVDERNIPSRKAVEKAGFQAVGAMRVQARMGVRRIRVDARPEARFLRTLERG